jgi:multidrug efflux pump subunit AcrA (membrane-fusion protein)
MVDAKTRFGTVKIDVPRDPELRPGMFAHGRIALGSVESVAVPDSAIVYKDAKSILFVAIGKTRAEARQIEIGARENGMVSVLSNLKAGEAVITSGVGYLKDGDDINVVTAAAANAVRPLPKTN